ncbi:hypothetical protein BKA66DRAFT_567994 [Pyrenochaeta sp. MPI-SDFR-AT-0127]|nr:hypothetical protein BKA66DRAFT_567994 [Pyrenochaeta sp. MPI-SDFR-AT-0127]
MDVSASTATLQRSPSGQLCGDGNALETFVKNEPAENGNYLGDTDKNEDEYRPRPQLPKPFVAMRTLTHLMKDLESGVIDVDPEYQREVVWTADRMTGLINSVMESFYIPPIILNKKIQPVSDRKKAQFTLVCVDGKQRLSSIRAFVKGMIPCHDHRGDKWWFCDNTSSRHKKILSGKIQKLFLSKELVSFEFTNLSPEQEEDLFARVQMGVQLSLAEKMRASTGPWQEVAKLFVDDFPDVYSLMKDRARAKDFQLTLSCFSQIMEVMHPTASNGIPVMKTNHAALPKLLSNTGAVDDGIKSHLASVWNTFKDLIDEHPDVFTNDSKYLRGVQTFAPVEMVAVTVLISMYADTRNNRVLLGDIEALRNALREQFVDLRLNAHVWKFTWDFIENLESIRGSVDGSTRNGKHLEELPNFAAANASAVALHSSLPSGKRARPAERATSPTILPPLRSVTIKREDVVSTRPSDTPLPKRRRTDQNSVPNEPSTLDYPAGTVESPCITNAHAKLPETQPSEHNLTTSSPVPSSHTSRPVHQPGMPSFSRQTRVLTESSPKQPVPVLVMASNDSLIDQPTHSCSQLPRRRSKLTISPTSRIEAIPHRIPTIRGTDTYSMVPAVPSSSQPPVLDFNPQIVSEHVALPTPSLVRQNRISELNAYQASVALKGTSTPIDPVSLLHLHSTPSAAPLNNDIAQQRNGNSTLGSITGAFAPNCTDDLWEGVLESVSPRMSQAIAPIVPSQVARSSASMTPLVHRKVDHKKRNNVIRPTPAQCESAIDLTSDTECEQERQNLLSSFQGRSTDGSHS